MTGILVAAIMAVPLSICGGATVDSVADSAPLLHRVGAFDFPTNLEPLGATGSLPHDTGLSPQLQHDANDPNALLTGAGSLANVPNGPVGIPGIVLQAYMKAQSTLAVEEPSCHLPWWLLAGIGKIESNQAEEGEVDASGMTLRPILGPVLNGTNGSAAIPAYNGGEWTGDAQWSRAVGPMQFLPSTWVEWGHGGNPNNVFDAAVAAGRYLCAGGRDLSDPAQQAAAVFSYNHSDSYVAKVLLWANSYRDGVTPLPETAVEASQPFPGENGTTPPPSTTTTPPPAGSTPPGTTTTGSTSPTTTGGGSTTKPPTTTTTPPPPTTTTAPPTTTTTPPPVCTTTPPTTTTAPPTTTTTPPPGCTTTTAPPTTTTGKPTVSTTPSATK